MTAQRMLREARILFAFTVCVAAFALFTYFHAQGQQNATNQRQTADENATCHIQQRGLPANKQLAIFVGDVHTLLTLTSPAQQKRNLARLPPKLRAREQALLESLDSSTSIYSMIEGKQPGTRKC